MKLDDALAHTARLCFVLDADIRYQRLRDESS
jgi:hypothetical protein